MKSSVIGILAAFAIIGSVTGCTENQRAKSLGGSFTVELPKDKKLVTATWKNVDLWYLVRDMREGEYPETYNFQEVSNFGILQGSITLVEQR